MKTTRIAQLALAAGVALTAAAPVFSAPEAPSAPQAKATERAERADRGERGHAKPGHHGMRGGPGAQGFGGHHGGAFLRGLDLTEAQRDKIFEIRHASAPEMRNHMKAAMQARKELRELVRAGSFDETRAKELAQTGANAMAEASLLRARNESQVLALLTPEQRAQLDERAQKREARHNARRDGRPGQARQPGQPGEQPASAPAAPAAQ